MSDDDEEDVDAAAAAAMPRRPVEWQRPRTGPGMKPTRVTHLMRSARMSAIHEDEDVGVEAPTDPMLNPRARDAAPAPPLLAPTLGTRAPVAGGAANVPVAGAAVAAAANPLVEPAERRLDLIAEHRYVVRIGRRRDTDAIVRRNPCG